MATTTETFATMATATGWTWDAVERRARPLRLASGDLFPKSGKGGGKRAAHVQAHHLVNLILTFAADGPSDALDAQQRLRSLRCRPGRRKTPPLVTGNTLAFMAGVAAHPTVEPTPADVLAQNFGERLESLITVTAKAIARGNDADLDQLRRAAWIITMSPDTRFAWVAWSEADNTLFTDCYTEAQDNLWLADALDAPPAQIRRSVDFTFSLIEVAATLLADTMAHQPTRRFRAPLLEGPEKQNARPLAGRALLTDQPGQQATDRDTSHPEPMVREGGAQALRRALRLFAPAGQSSFPERTSRRRHHARPHSTDPAAA